MPKERLRNEPGEDDRGISNGGRSPLSLPLPDMVRMNGMQWNGGDDGVEEGSVGEAVKA